MVLLLWAVAPLLAHAQLGASLNDRIEVIQGERMLSLQWADTEDVLKGGILPAPLTAGTPFTVSLRIEPVTGKGQDMPVVLTLRQTGQEQGESKVVTRKDGVWTARFTPPRAGAYLLDVSFRTIRAKVLHTDLTVRPEGVPPIAWSLFGLVALGIGFGVWRKRRQEVRPRPENPQ